MIITNLRRKFLIPLAVVLSSVVVFGLLGAGAGMASTGVDGMKIKYIKHNATSQCTTGTVRNGGKEYFLSRVCNPLDNDNDKNVDDQHHWLSPVKITWHNSSENSEESTTCYAPKEQQADYFSCPDPMRT